MSELNCTVTPGYTFTPTAQFWIWLTHTKLNQAANPTVTVPMDGLVAPADLTTALSAKIVAPDITVAAEVSDAVSVTIQMQNSVASDITGYHLLRCWLVDAAYGALTGTEPNTDVTITTGVEVQEVVSKKHFIVQTDSDGVAVIKVDNTAGTTDSWYLMVEIQGKVLASAIITITV